MLGQLSRDSVLVEIRPILLYERTNERIILRFGEQFAEICRSVAYSYAGLVIEFVFDSVLLVVASAVRRLT